MGYKYGLIDDHKSYNEAMVCIETLEITLRVLEHQKNTNVVALVREITNTLLNIKSEVRRYRLSLQNVIPLPTDVGIKDFDYYRSKKYDKED